MTGAAVAGSLLGSRLTGLVAPDRLRRIFGWFVVAMAGLVLAQQLPGGLRHDLLGTAPGWGVLLAIAAAAAIGLPPLCRAVRRPSFRALS